MNYKCYKTGKRAYGVVLFQEYRVSIFLFSFFFFFFFFFLLLSWCDMFYVEFFFHLKVYFEENCLINVFIV